MKRFNSNYRFLFSRRLVGVAGAVILLGLLAGGSFFVQSRQLASTAGCSSYTVVMCNIPNQDAIVQQQYVVATGQAHQANQPRNRSKVVPRTHVVHTPAGSSAQRAVPEPVTTSTPVSTAPPSPPTSQSSVTAMIEQVFGSYASSALTVARCESGLNPNAYNPTSIGGSHAEGVFQILYPSTWDSTSEAASSPYNAMANVRAAYQIFSRDGYNWHEWSCAS